LSHVSFPIGTPGSDGAFGVKGCLGTGRLAAWSTPGEGFGGEGFGGAGVELAALKAGLAALCPRATVNDAVLACVAAAVGELGGAKVATAVVPVNLRPLLAALSGRVPSPDAALRAKVKHKRRACVCVWGGGGGSGTSIVSGDVSLCAWSQVQMMQGNKIGALLLDLPTAAHASSRAAHAVVAEAGAEAGALAPLVAEVSRRMGW
jgi:hypothetical protein